MRELEQINIDAFQKIDRSIYTLLLLEESAITCRTLPNIIETISQHTNEIIIAMPDDQYSEGLRGYAKVSILVSMTGSKIRAIIPASYELAKSEIENKWSAVGFIGNATWKKTDVIRQSEENIRELTIVESADPFDTAMMERAKAIISKSNCWLDPAGVVIVRDREIIVEACSTNFNGTNCTSIPIHWTEMNLRKGERPLFCDSLHSERMAISEAAKQGKSLEGATMYLNKFPCRPCAQSTIAAGIKTIVFEVGSYGLLETADLFNVSGTKLVRVIPSEAK